MSNEKNIFGSINNNVISSVSNTTVNNTRIGDLVPNTIRGTTITATEKIIVSNISNFEDITIDASDNFIIKSNLIVDNNVIIGENLTVNGDVSINDNVNINGNVIIDENLTVNGDVSINDNLYINGNVIIDENLTVNQDLNILGNTNILSSVFIDENVNISGNLIVNETVKFNKTLDVSDNVNFNNNLFVNGDSSFNGNVIIDENLIVNQDIYMFGNTNILSSVFIDENVNISGNLIVDETVKFNKTLDVSDNVNISGNLIVDETVKFNKTLDVSDNVNISGNLIVDETVKFNKTLDVSDNVNISGNLIVDESVKFNSTLDVSDNVNISGNLIVDKTVKFNSTLDVSDNVNISGNLIVDKTVKFNSTLDVSDNVNISGNLIVDESVKFNSTLDVSDNVNISGNLIVDESVKFNSTLDVSDNVNISGNLIVDESVKFNSTLDVSDNVNISGNLIVDKTVKFNSTLDVSDNVNISGNLIVDKSIKFNSTLDVSDNVNISGNLIVDKSVKFNKTLDVSDNVNISGNLIVDETVKFNKTLDVSDNVNISGNLIVNENSKFNKNLNIFGELFVDGNFTVMGESTTLKSQTVEISDNILLINSNLTGNPPPTLVSGIRVNRGDLNDYYFVFTEDDGKELFKIGTSNNETGDDLQAVATREDNPSNNNIAVWNNNLKMFVTNRGFTVNENNDVVINGNTTIKSNLVAENDVDISGNLKTNLIIPAERLTIIGDLDVSGILLKDGEELLTGGVIKAKDDEDAILTLKGKQISGDLYFNNLNNAFKIYYSDVNNVEGKWVDIELGQVSSQPPPILDLSFITTTGYVDITWRNPVQIPSAITSDISFNLEHSPAVIQHPITDKNMIFFPIINRICIKLRPITINLDTNEYILGNYESYPLYTSSNQKNFSSISQVENNGFVIYRKGDKVAGQTGSLRDNYVSEINPNRNLAINMPNKLRIYKVVPSSYNFNLSDISDTILPFILENNPLSKGADGYRVEIWLENNSLYPVNIKSIDVFYDVAPAPGIPQFLEVSYKATENVNYNNSTNKNPFISCKLLLEDPLFVGGNDDSQDDLVNFTMKDFKWSIDNNNWNNFSKISLVENNVITNMNILDSSFNYNINRPVDQRITPRKRYEYEFKINNEYMTSVENTNLFSNTNRNKLYIRVRYKNGSSPNLGIPRIFELDLDTPTKPVLVDMSYNNTTPNNSLSLNPLTTVDFTVQDPSSIIIGNNTQNIKITGIKFEWSINDTNNWYNFVKLEDINNNNNSINLDNSGIQLLNQNNTFTRKYRFNIDDLFMGSNVISLLTNGLQTLKLRISYRNSAKIVFGDTEMDSLILDKPSIPQNLVLSFNNTNNLIESKCKLVATPPTNVIINNTYANSFTNRNNISASINITGIKFEWGVSSINSSDVSWNNFNRIFKISERVLSNGIYNVNLPITNSGVLGDFFFDVNTNYMTNILSLLTNNNGTKYLFTRISYRNSVKPEFSDVKISNVLIFDKPSIPQEIKLQYLLNNTNSNTLCKLDFKDPVNLLGNNIINNTILQFTGIKYEWSINDNNWNEVQKIVDNNNVKTLNNGVYDLSFNHNTNLRTYNIFITSEYLVKSGNTNSTNNFNTLITDNSTNLYFRVSYRNSSKSEFSENITSNFLVFINPTIPRNIILDYRETDNNSITKYNMVITDPSFVLSYYNDVDASNVNAIVKITDIELEWSINGSNWNDFINIVENGFNSNNLNSLSSGLYSRTRLLTNNTTYIFDLSNNYMSNILSLVYNGLSNNNLPYPLYTKTAYRNSTKLELSPDLSSNVLFFDRPSEPRLVNIEYNNTTTSKMSRIKLTVLDPSNVINVYNDSYNNIIKYTGLKIEWDTNSNFNNPKNLLLIEDSGNKNMTNGIYTTLKAHSNINRIFYFEMNDTFMNNFNSNVFTNNNPTNIYLRVSHRNSTLANFSNNTISNFIVSDVPSIPNKNVLSFRDTVSGITRCNIEVIDPSYIVNYYSDNSVNSNVNITNIKFEWSIDENNWFNLQKINDSGVINLTNGNKPENRLITSNSKTYIIDISSHYFTYNSDSTNAFNFLLDNPSTKLYIKISYQNSTKNKFGEILTSNGLEFNKPSPVQIIDLSFNNTTSDNFTKCKISVLDPIRIIENYDLNSIISIRNIKFEWKNNSSSTWRPILRLDSNTSRTQLYTNTTGIYNNVRNISSNKIDYYFDVNNIYLGSFVNEILDNSNNVDLQIRISYQNTINNIFSEFTNSNEIRFDITSTPTENNINYILSNDITRIMINVKDPDNILINQPSVNNLNITGIKFEWSLNNSNWNNFNRVDISGGSSNIVLSNGIYNINRILTGNIIYIFSLNNAYLGNIDNSLNIDITDIYVKVSYRNSTQNRFSNTLVSNFLKLNIPSEPRILNIDYKETLSNKTTRCKIEVIDPSFVLNYYNDINDINVNNLIKYNGYKFEWATEPEGAFANWGVLNGIIDTSDNLASNTRTGITNGILENLKTHRDNIRTFYFDISSDYLGNNVSNFVLNQSNSTNIYLRMSYRNTTVKNFSNTKISNLIKSDVPSSPRSVILSYLDVNNGNQRCKIDVVDPSFVINYYNNSEMNSKVNFTGIKFEWSVNENDWYNFTSMNVPNGTFSNSINSINRLLTDNINTFSFELTSAFLGNITAFNNLKQNGGNLFVKVSYQNSTKSAFSLITKSNNIILTTPSKPNNVNLELNRNINSQTECNLIIVDPDFANNNVNTDNTKINVSGIKFEWSINNSTWNNFLKIKVSGSDVSTTSGIYNINRAFTSNNNNFNFEINNSYLSNFPVLNTTTNLYIKVSYRNTVINNFGNTEQSFITFAKPSIHSILDVNMNTSTSVNVRIPAITSQNKMNGDGSVSTNNNAIFINQVELLVKRKLDDNNYLDISNIVYNYSGNNNNDTITSYTFNIPPGLINGTFALNNYRFAFSIRLKNNLINEWSIYSSVNTNINNDNAENLYISQITTNNTINNITQATQDTVNLSWNHPANLNRGVLKAGNTIPIVYDYSANLYDTNYPNLITNFINITNNRTTDASNIRNSVAINNILQNVANNNSDNTTKTIKIDVYQRNEYISNPSKISKDYFYVLTKSNNPVINTSSSSINSNTTVNSITYKWTKPTEPGLRVGNLSNSLTNFSSMVINQYIVEITADRINSNSPVLKNSTNASITITINATNTTSEANTYLSNDTAGLINKNSSFTTITGNKNDVLVYPDTTYTFNIKARNRYNIVNDGNSINIITGNPSSPDVNLFGNTSLPIATTVNLSGYTKYTNSGFLRGDSNKTNLSIINASNLTTSFSATGVNHRMNLNRLNLLVNASNINLTNISNINVRQFRIVNVANNEVIYKFGINGNIYDTSLNNYGITSISSSNRQDLFSRTNYDTNNRGYWWMETVNYTINFNNKNTNLYGKPIRLDLQVRYNKETTNYNTSSLENDGNVNVFSRQILNDSANSANSASNAFFDNLSGNPTISNVSLVEITNTNKINGIPNLSPITGKSYTYRVKYLLGNYSQYYDLNATVNISTLDLIGTSYTKNSITGFTFNNHNPSQMIRNNNSWDVSFIDITNSNVGNSTTLDKEIKLRINATNTNGNTQQTPSSLITFINDKNSVDRLALLLLSTSATFVPTGKTNATGKGQLITVPNNFTPHLFAYASNENNRLLSSSNVDTVYNNYENFNSYQLPMYNGYFGSTEWLRQQLGGVGGNLATLKTKYNLPDYVINDNYSYSIFKFVRKHNLSGTINYFEFVLELDENNIEFNDLYKTDNTGGENVKILIQSYRRTVDTNNVSLITYNSPSSETSTPYNWVLYRPNRTSNAASADGTVSLSDTNVNTGLGNNGGNLSLTQTIFNNTYYANKSGILGVFKTSGGISVAAKDNIELIFYVAIGIKNNVNKYFKGINSFDIYNTTAGSISRN
jgi:UDP-3-O-[3-hydroxymyristoyl] glucosamine N-acyltransferase